MIRSRTLTPLLVLALAAPIALAAPAQADDTVLAPAPNTSGITAYGGQVVLSQLDPVTNEWALVRLENGALIPLPVPERSVPFDADAGPDAAGKPVVVYSRCTQDPTANDAGLGPTLDWETATGCDLYELTLTGTPTEHELKVASAPGESETTPSIWQGNLAFVRHANDSAVPTIEYLPLGATKPRHLSGGSVQLCESYGSAKVDCGFDAVHDTVDQLDLGFQRIAYTWAMVGGSVYGVGAGWELRAATLDGGRSLLLDAGVVSGTCGFDLPSAPTVTPLQIAYLSAGAVCDTTQTSFATGNVGSGVLSTSPTPGGLAAGAVVDGNTIYWLRVTGNPNDVPVPGAGSCLVADAACQLVASDVPQYVPQPLKREMTAPADIDFVRSGLGYKWIAGPGGTRLLLPPPTIPCAPSAVPAYVYVSAQWTRGKHTIRVSRQDLLPRRASRTVTTITRSLPDEEVAAEPQLAVCGQVTRFTYAVSTGRSTQTVSFTVTRRRDSAGDI
jgi:hypothetical protein